MNKTIEHHEQERKFPHLSFKQNSFCINDQTFDWVLHTFPHKTIYEILGKYKNVVNDTSLWEIINNASYTLYESTFSDGSNNTFFTDTKHFFENGKKTFTACSTKKIFEIYKDAAFLVLSEIKEHIVCAAHLYEPGDLHRSFDEIDARQTQRYIQRSIQKNISE